MPAAADEVLSSAEAHLAEEIAGLDALESFEPSPRRGAALWAATWPKLAAVALGLLLWQAVVWTNWKPDYILPGPGPVLRSLWQQMGQAALWTAVGTTLRRAASGFALALVVGGAVGLAVASSRVVRSAVGSMITGIQTMPSVVWFPLALVLFQRSEKAILFVVVLGAAPSIANGLTTGVDNIPPLLLRAGRVLGTTRLTQLRHVVLPGALPSFVGGLKQGWAFAWRSLLAGELLVVIADKPSIGSTLEFDRQFSDYTGMLAVMIVILAIGVLMDAFVFANLDRAVRRRRGLAA